MKNQKNLSSNGNNQNETTSASIINNKSQTNRAGLRVYKIVILGVSCEQRYNNSPVIHRNLYFHSLSRSIGRRCRQIRQVSNVIRVFKQRTQQFLLIRLSHPRIPSCLMTQSVFSFSPSPLTLFHSRSLFFPAMKKTDERRKALSLSLFLSNSKL
jgi:hypothetical protein